MYSLGENGELCYTRLEDLRELIVAGIEAKMSCRKEPPMSRLLLSSIVFLFITVLFVCPANAEKVVLPLTLDYNLLTSLLVQNGFSGENTGTSLVGKAGDCMRVEISEPQYSTVGKLLRLELRLFIRIGTEVGDRCLLPVEWQGYLELLQQPKLDEQTFSLSFQTVDSSLLTLARKPASIAGILWEFAKPRVYDHLDAVRIDLAPPVADLQDFLAPLFHGEARQASKRMFDSLHGGQVVVGQDGVIVELLGEVEEVFEPEKEGAEVKMTAAERDQVVQLWETWDALLVCLLETLSDRPLSSADQQLLGEVLLDARYVLVAALEQQDGGEDIVRKQFVWAWQQLAPVFRRQLYAEPSKNSLGYLAFFTAADALTVLDRMGPTLGIEISRQGLLRLAAMLGGEATTLPYSLEIDHRLRKLLQLRPIEEQETLPDSQKEIDLPVEESIIEPLARLFDYLSRPVHGADLPSNAEILQWKVPEKNIAAYLAAVRAVLDDASADVVSSGDFPTQFVPMFTTLAPAVAWQESCFRQFIVKEDKLTYLLSYSGSAVGLMQVNERVWRGVYDRRLLRWDIRYNARAGCEIMELYLRRYALQKKTWNKDSDSRLLARTVYAMYNGGPTQYEKFLARHRTDSHYSSDLLFLEKMQWTENNQWEYVDRCLTGG